MKVLYPNLLDIGCYSHTIDHVGEMYLVPNLNEFGVHWVSLFSHRPKASLLWEVRTGRLMQSHSKTRWGSQWEIYQQM